MNTSGLPLEYDLSNDSHATAMIIKLIFEELHRGVKSPIEIYLRLYFDKFGYSYTQLNYVKTLFLQVFSFTE